MGRGRPPGESRTPPRRAWGGPRGGGAGAPPGPRAASPAPGAPLAAAGSGPSKSNGPGGAARGGVGVVTAEGEGGEQGTPEGRNRGTTASGVAGAPHPSPGPAAGGLPRPVCPRRVFSFRGWGGRRRTPVRVWDPPRGSGTSCPRGHRLLLPGPRGPGTGSRGRAVCQWYRSGVCRLGCCPRPGTGRAGAVCGVETVQSLPFRWFQAEWEEPAPPEPGLARGLGAAAAVKSFGVNS